MDTNNYQQLNSEKLENCITNKSVTYLFIYIFYFNKTNSVILIKAVYYTFVVWNTRKPLLFDLGLPNIVHKLIELVKLKYYFSKNLTKWFHIYIYICK